MLLGIDPRSWSWRMVRAVAVLMFILVAIAVADAKPGNKGGGGGGGNEGNCNSPKVACSTAASDITAPTISITAPADGASVTGLLTVAGTASDDVSLKTVTVKVDDGSFGQADGTTTWSIAVDLTQLATGTHSITARATDSSGNWTDAAISVVIEPVALDAEPPVISILTPADGASVDPSVLVAGTASDGLSLADVSVKVDGGSYLSLGSAAEWSHEITGLSSGSHTITARATDAASNTSSTSITVEVPATEALRFSSVAAPTSSWESLVPLGRTRAAEQGSVSAALYHTQFSHYPALFFRDSSTGSTATLALPADSTDDWWQASYAWTSGNEFWVLSGGGPITVRRYRLSGTPIPTSASLLEVKRFGDTDSRPGDLIVTAEGGIVAAWHQQGSTSPQGQRIAYRAPGAGSWTMTSLSYIPSKASKDVLVQHPADGSIWMFTNPDGWSSIGAARLVASGDRLVLDGTDAYFIDSSYGDHDADPENPDLAVARDESRGEIVLAYQSAARKRYSSSVIGSYPAIARIRGDGSMSFTHLPVYVERVSSLGLVVRPGELWLAYRPVEDDLTFDELWVARLANGAWTETHLGKLYAPYDRIAAGISRPEFSARMGDDRLRLFYR